MHEIARATPRMRTAELSFADVPHQSRLFLDYLSDPLSLKTFYPNAVGSPVEAAAQAPEVLREYVVDRAGVCDALFDINRRAGASEKAFENIEKLRDPDCVAVLTGQQVGLFTGPLYTIYKALSAVRLAEELNERGTKAVPIFWAATEDHDLAEVSGVSFIGSRGREESVRYPHDGKPGLQVGDVVLGDDIQTLVSEAFTLLPTTEFSSAIRRSIAESWSPGQRWGDAFLRTLALLFKDCGIVLADPMHAGLRKLAAPVVSQALQRSAEITSALLERTVELSSAGYHSQVLIQNDHVPLFLIDQDGRRSPLRAGGEGGFILKGTRTQFDRDDLLSIVSESPERLSPGVMLRPVAQDYLFPTLCYFGGGAEIAYFAQSSELYRVLERRVTPIFHRQSFTILEPNHRRALERHALSLSDLFTGKDTVEKSLAAREDMPAHERAFEDAEAAIASELNRLDLELNAIDPTIANNLATRRRKIIYHLRALRNKAVAAFVRKDHERSVRIDALFSSLLPNGELQERSINVLTYLNKYGPNFIRWVYRETDVNRKGHVILDI